MHCLGYKTKEQPHLYILIAQTIIQILNIKYLANFLYAIIGLIGMLQTCITTLCVMCYLLCSSENSKSLTYITSEHIQCSL